MKAEKHCKRLTKDTKSTYDDPAVLEHLLNEEKM